MSAPEEHHEQQHIGAETDDELSSIGDNSSDGSQDSLRSTILEYRLENGRTYHKVSDGKYILPNDAREQDRLDITNHLWSLTWDGQLCNCPKKNGATRVLDVGTGTGIWAMDYADEHPEATVLGVDLSPIQPGFVPPNCSFEVDDIEKEWTWTVPFDFIFFRHMAGSLADWSEIIAKAYDNLEPGGYIELQDHTGPPRCDDGTLKEDSKYHQWSMLILEGFKKMGRPVLVVQTFKQLLLDAGFEDVVEKKEKWPISPWSKDPKLKELGFWSYASSESGIEAVSTGLFTRVLGWTVEEARVLAAEVRNEHKSLEIHAYYDVYSVWGRKPEKKKEEK
ncbi:methyltransferase domain-containing protein [Colletotrichum musicola]|uniref:Methyltransferase domain-containing protein n=1 Tax=Colletotrichum musicola TaxID=2175873 RepID=A0A8H6U941_9PEZI|nr:methyltransferase domain-containing protein [Colletotrichum musicola]